MGAGVADELFALERAEEGGALALLVPSRFEGFGMIAAEGLTAGVPVVASRIVALVEVVRPPQGGIVFTPGDPAALTRAVGQRLDSRERRVALGLAGGSP